VVDEADHLERGLRIVAQVVVQRGGRRDALMMKQERIAVGIGLGHALGSDRAARAADVLDDDLLPERAPHVLSQQTCDRVGRPACGEWNNERDRFRRIVVRGGNGWQG